MKLTPVCNDPSIIDVEIPELESFNFEKYFSLTSKRSDYGELVVEEGRLTVEVPNPLHGELCQVMADPIYRITEKLFSMESIRYPLFHYRDFDDFYKQDVLDRDRIGILGTTDCKGFNQPWHLDNRFVLVSCSINVQDNITSTHFAKQNFHWPNGGTSFDHCDLIYKGRTTKFTGTAWINTEHTWHCVPRVVEDKRKTILFNVFL